MQIKLFIISAFAIIIYCFFNNGNEIIPDEVGKETDTIVAGPVSEYIPQSGLTMKDNTLVWSNKDNLPSPFVNSDGSVITTTEEWEARREVLLGMLEYYVHGARPDFEINRVEVSNEYKDAQVSSNAITYEARIFYDENRFFNIRVTRPKEEGKYPIIMRYESNESYRFPIEKDCIGDGKYIIVALNNLSVAPDKGEITSKYMHETKAIMAWGYAASLTVDYLETLNFVDITNIAIAGMSRTGKAAICAGIYDERFSIIIANSSGAAGASGFRNFGEEGTQAIHIAEHEPTWVSEKLLEYIEDASKLPLDMHYARALIAPRVILTTEASDGGDAIWAGPVSTYKMWLSSDYAFELYNCVNHNLIHLRSGEHAQLWEDYLRMMTVVDYVCYGKSFDPFLFRVNQYPGR